MSLASELAFLANPTPEIADTEDFDDNSAARLVDEANFIDKNEDTSKKGEFGSLRKRTALIVHGDKRYSGQTVSRKKLNSDSGDSDFEEDSDDDDEISDNDDMDEDNDNIMESFIKKMRKNKGDKDTADDSDEEEMSDNEEDDDDKVDSDIEDEEDSFDDDDEEFNSYGNKLKNGKNQSDNSEDFSEESDIEENTKEQKFNSNKRLDQNKLSNLLVDGDDDMSDDGMSDDEDEDLSDSNDAITAHPQADEKEEFRKANAVKLQLGMWDDLLKLRIELQKSLALVNKLPQPGESYERFEEEADGEYKASLGESKSTIVHMLNQFVHLRSILLKQNKDTKDIVNAENKRKRKFSKNSAKNEDDEITSESEIESDDGEGSTGDLERVNDDVITSESDEDDDNDETLKNCKRLRIDEEAITSDDEERDACKNSERAPDINVHYQMADFGNLLNKHRRQFLPYRNETIEKWYSKTLVVSARTSKSFKAFEKSALTQISHILADQERLTKRTQLRRSAYRILGESDLKDQSKDTKEVIVDGECLEMPKTKNSMKDYNEEIFDDEDFYHQLLRELIERKANESNDNNEMSQKWIAMQNLRPKYKRDQSEKVNKDRKIRYYIHKNLVSFMAPLDNSTWTDEARDELYSSLFGRVVMPTEVLPNL